MAALVRTRNDLILRTLKLMGAMGVGQQPTDDDKQAVEDQIETLLDMLERKSIMQFPDRTEFETAIIQPLALALASQVGPDLAVSKIVGYEQYSLDQVLSIAESQLRFLNAEDLTNEPIVFKDY